MLYDRFGVCYTRGNMMLTVLQIISAVLVIVAIELQARGSGVGLAFGGDGNVYRTRRGIEKKLHVATIALVVVFFGLSLVNALV